MDIDTDALAADLARTLRGVAVDALPEAIERRLTGVPPNELRGSASTSNAAAGGPRRT
ncbi:MAG: hypothetical protein H6736_24150 [Alphaproteobacteria bacterium]|nr:hypothetical protein [Alphaproteobacteria bacterium]